MKMDLGGLDPSSKCMKMGWAWTGCGCAAIDTGPLL